MTIPTEFQLSAHFSWEEATVTSTGIPNIPSIAQMNRMRHTALQMEIVRACLLRKPIKVNSWFRSAEVNKAVGGSPTSEHALGAAVDFTCAAAGTPLEICKSLLPYSHILNYNQLIYETSWIHISFPPDGQIGKREVLTYLGAGKGYTKGIYA